MLRAGIDRWAEGRGVPPASVDVAFGIMIGLLDDFGATDSRIAQLDRDPTRVAVDVLAKCKHRLVAADEHGKIVMDDDGTPRPLDSETRAAYEQIAVVFYQLLFADPETRARLDSATVQELYGRELAKDDGGLSRRTRRAPAAP